VLQKLVEVRKLRAGINYATTPKTWLMKRTRSLTVPFASPRSLTFPDHVHYFVSLQRSLKAELNEPNSMPGLTNREIVGCGII
jgi:hypothetical protein